MVIFGDCSLSERLVVLALHNGVTFYISAYWYHHNKAVLLKSTDGINWEFVSTINEGERNEENEIIFLSDGCLMATARLE